MEKVEEHSSSRIFSERLPKRHFFITKEKKRTQRTQSEASSTSNFVSSVLLCVFFVKTVSFVNYFENSE